MITIENITYCSTYTKNTPTNSERSLATGGPITGNTVSIANGPTISPLEKSPSISSPTMNKRAKTRV